eukprot:6180255-Amphidinium_carterae.1
MSSGSAAGGSACRAMTPSWSSGTAPARFFLFFFFASEQAQDPLNLMRQRKGLGGGQVLQECRQRTVPCNETCTFLPYGSIYGITLCDRTNNTTTPRKPLRTMRPITSRRAQNTHNARATHSIGHMLTL